MSGSLFQGRPQTATSYVTSSAETPKWMQDAIYNQIQLATNVANRPYQPYSLPTVAELSPLQQQAYAQVQRNVGAWQPDMGFATSGMKGFADKGTADQLQAEQAKYLRQDLVGKNLDAGQQLFGRSAGMDVVGAGQPYLQRAAAQDVMGAAQPYLQGAAAQDVMGAANPLLSRAAQMSALTNAQPLLGKSTALNAIGAAQPYLGQAGTTTAEALSERALAAANPYLQAAGQTSASQVGQYMSPYQQGVLDVIAKQGARNLSENLLPQVSDAFIKAGQFGSRRMGEFGSRALRDTQEAVLNAQAQAAQQGYGQSLSAAQADLARQAQLAGTVGSISGADLSRILQGGAQYGNLGQTAGQLTSQQAQNLLAAAQATGQMTTQEQQALANIGQTAGQLTAQQAGILSNIGQTAGQLTGQQAGILSNIGQTTGQLTSQQMQNLANLGQMQTGAGQAQQQFGLTAAQQAQQAQAQDYARQMAALQNVANMAQQTQGLRTADVAALESAGQAQQAQMQAQLNASRQQFEAARDYPQQQLDWLSTQVRGMAPLSPPITTQMGQTSGASYSPSPLSQLATGLYTAKGLGAI